MRRLSSTEMSRASHHSSASEVLSQEGSLSVVDIVARRLVSNIELGFDPQRVFFSADGSRIYCCSAGKPDQRP